MTPEPSMTAGRRLLMEMQTSPDASEKQHDPPGPRRPAVIALAAFIFLCLVSGLLGTCARSSEGAGAKPIAAPPPPAQPDISPVVAAPPPSTAPPAPAPAKTAAPPKPAPPAAPPPPIAAADTQAAMEDLDDPLGIDGRFKTVCKYSHSAKDDPIVHFGEPGASHSHDFFGNTSTNAFSTYQTLRAMPATTCGRHEDAAAYWVPSLIVDGRVVRPTRAVAYYLTGGKPGAAIRPFPPNFKAVTVMGKKAEFLCAGRSSDVRPAGTPPTCPSNTYVIVRILFPDCWDGRTDSPDHRSHLAFNVRGVCPVDHPIPVPQIRLSVEYPPGGARTIALSSGGPETLHADYFNSWDQAGLERLVRGCINANVKCELRNP
jgi:hypothetical protein